MSVGAYVYLPLHLREEPGGSKECRFRNIKLYYKVDSLLGEPLPKRCIISKNASNERCYEFNLVQNVYVYLSPEGI